MKGLRYILLALALCPGLHTLSAQRAAVRTNLLGLAAANLNVEVSCMLNRSWSAHLSLQAKPWAYPLPAPVGFLRYIEGLDKDTNNVVELGTIQHTENYTAQPSLRYWMNGVYNRGLFFGVHGIATMFKYGGERFDSNYRDGWGLGAGLSLGYSYELSKRWNIEFELGVAALYRHYHLVSGDDKLRSRQAVSNVIPTFSRLGVSLVYVL